MTLMKTHHFGTVNRWTFPVVPSRAGRLRTLEQEPPPAPPSVNTSRDRARRAVAATMFEHVGGEAALRRTAEHSDEAVFGDELLGKLFRYGGSHHVDHLTAFLAEVLGGPRRYSEELGECAGQGRDVCHAHSLRSTTANTMSRVVSD
ncbi:hypothetical protein GCM10010266_59330 [Streptomyces griseomycini]|nr:hypothetical protein GCM10010266_59330 [Streptomyces griseomycini]